MKTREEIVSSLAARGRLWRLIDHYSCRFCARPRLEDRGYAVCYDCAQLSKRYGNALTDLVPITYTTSRWALGTGLRDFKDTFHANPNSPLAPRFGAVLSAFLEHQMPRLSPWGFSAVVPVPSSKPAVVAALQAAEAAGWWVPPLLTGIAAAEADFPRQREREGRERPIIEGKWRVERNALAAYPEVLILDDMTTSGGTLHSFARALRLEGAQRVTAVVLARNLGDDGDWVLPLLRAQLEQGLLWSPEHNKRDLIRP